MRYDPYDPNYYLSPPPRVTMRIRAWIRDKWRGYSGADLFTAIALVNNASAGSFVPLTKKQYKAYISPEREIMMR